MEDETIVQEAAEEATEVTENAEAVSEEENTPDAPDAPDAEEDTAEDEDEGFDIDSLEYDEDGNIIIPDDIDNEDASDEGEDKADEESADDSPENNDDELARLREELEELKSQSKDTLKKLGIDNEDVMEGLAELAAESSDLTLDEYKTKRADERAKEREAQTKRVSEFEALAASDLAELKAYYPETKEYKHVKDMPDEILKKFANYRNLGLPAREAYAAANPEGIRAGAAESAARKAKNDSKAHLKTSQPKGGRREGTYIPRSEMGTWRSMFPGKSDREIVALYKKTL